MTGIHLALELLCEAAEVAAGIIRQRFKVLAPILE
jgi:hypothetical protein